MKKIVMCLVIVVAICLIVPVSVYAVSGGGYSSADMPTPPSAPEWMGGYAVIASQYTSGQLIPPKNYIFRWNIYMVDDPEGFMVVQDGDVLELKIKTGVRVTSYECGVCWDEELQNYFINDWKEKLNNFIVESPYGAGVLSASWMEGDIPFNSHDILTASGNVYVTRNPCPPPPLVGTVQLEMVPGVVGGVAKIIIPVGLVVLLVLLLMALIRYLLRLWTLRVKS